MLTREEKIEMREKAYAILEKSFKKFYDSLNEDLWKQDLVEEISKILHNGLPLHYHRNPLKITIRDIKEYWIWIDLDDTKFYIYDFSDEELIYILWEMKRNQKIFEDKNFEIFKKEQQSKYENETKLEKKVLSIDIEEFGQQIQEITNEAIEGGRDLLKAYVLLKRLENGVKFNSDKLKDLAYNQYIDRALTPRDEIAFGYGFVVTNRKTINFKEDETYAKINEELKKREEILKNAVNQSDKNNTLVDENWEVIQPPSYTFSSSLTIKKI